MSRFCKGCKEEIHPLRIKALPNTQTCVNCSTTGAIQAITVLNGDVGKDDTWVDIVFMDRETYESYTDSSKKQIHISKTSSKPEILNFDNDEEENINGLIIEE
jgi:hypothetical protein